MAYMYTMGDNALQMVSEMQWQANQKLAVSLNGQCYRCTTLCRFTQCIEGDMSVILVIRVEVENKLTPQYSHREGSDQHNLVITRLTRMVH